MKYELDFEYELDDDKAITVYITEFDFGSPGKTWGPPESCYPADPPEIYWYALNEEGKELELTNRQKEAIESKAWEKIEAEVEASWERYYD